MNLYDFAHCFKVVSELRWTLTTWSFHRLFKPAVLCAYCQPIKSSVTGESARVNFVSTSVDARRHFPSLRDRCSTRSLPLSDILSVPTDWPTSRATDSPVQTNTAPCGHRPQSVLPSTSTDTPTKLLTLGRRNVTLRTRRRRRFTRWPEMSVNSPFENSTSKSEEPLRRPGPVLSGAGAGEPGQDLGFLKRESVGGEVVAKRRAASVLPLP